MIADHLATGREWVERILTDHVTIERPDGVTVDDLGTETTAWRAVWTGPGLVQQEASTRRDTQVQAGGQDVDLTPYVLKCRHDRDVQPGDRVSVTASLDPRHVRRKWLILDAPTQAWTLLRRCPIDPL